MDVGSRKQFILVGHWEPVDLLRASIFFLGGDNLGATKGQGWSKVVRPVNISVEILYCLNINIQLKYSTGHCKPTLSVL